MRIDKFQIPLPFNVDSRKNYSEGAYGIVFFEGLIATKIFKRASPSKSEKHIRGVLESEVGAYEIVSAHAELCKITPKFLGRVEFGNIIDNKFKQPCADQLLLDCAYQMEYIPYRFDKLIISQQKYKHIATMFKEAGVEYTGDVSAVLGEDGEIECLIDFATRDYSREL